MSDVCPVDVARARYTEVCPWSDEVVWPGLSRVSDGDLAHSGDDLHEGVTVNCLLHGTNGSVDQ